MVTVSPTDRLGDALQRLKERRFRHLPVTADGQSNGKLVGILSVTDIYRALPAQVNPLAVSTEEITALPPLPAVAEVMTASPRTVLAEDSIEHAARLLTKYHIGALPVVRKDGTLFGIVSETDVLRALVSLLHIEDGARITIDHGEQKDLLDELRKLSWNHDVELRSFFLFPHGERIEAVIWVHGLGLNGFIDAVWKSGHRVLNVTRSRDAQHP